MDRPGIRPRLQHSAAADEIPREPRRPTPCLWPAVGFMLGIWLSESVGVAAGWPRAVLIASPVVALVLLAAVLWRDARRRPSYGPARTNGVAPRLLEFARNWLPAGLIAAIALPVGFVRHQATLYRPPDHIVHVLADEPVLTRLAGRIVTSPIERPPLKLNPFLPFNPAPRTQFVLAVEELRTTEPATPTTGQVRVSVEAAGLGLKLGQPVQVTGRLWRPFGPRNPGEMDWSRWFRQQQIDAGMSVEGSAHVTLLPGDVSWWYGLVTALRSRAQSLLFEPYADWDVDESARLLDVMILGQRSVADRALNEAFLRAGGLHFLAVSGFNVMVLAGTAWWAVRRLLRRGEGTAAVVAVLLTLLFALVTEPNAPILRATIAVVLVTLARVMKRPICPVNSLALGAACILIGDPNALFGPAFQLTFVQVLMLIVVCPRMWRAVYPGLSRVVVHPGMYGDTVDQSDGDPHPAEAQTLWEYSRLYAVRWIVALVLVCVCAWASALPLVLWHFGRFSSWGWLGTIPLTPLVTLVTLLSLFTIAANAVLPPLGALLSCVLQWSADGLLWSVRLFEHFPAAVIECQPPPWCLVVASYGAGLALWMWWATPRRPVAEDSQSRRSRPVVRVRTFVTINVIALLALAWLGWVVVPGGWRGAGCTLQVLAIGNGSTMLLTAPGAHAAILDVGTDTNSDPGETAALALHAAGLRHVEAVVVSHGNFDHHSGLPTLLRRVPVERWLTNSYFTTQGETESSTDRLLRRLPDGVSKHDVLRAGERLALGEVTLEVLWPRDGLGLTWDDNNASLVMRISAAGRTILVTGDIERDAMKALVEGEQAGRISLKSDVLIAPHHGAVLKNVTGEFYAAVSPSVVVVSTRTERPKLETLVGNVLGPKVRIVETGRVGAVTVRITPAGELLIETPFCRPPGG